MTPAEYADKLRIAKTSIPEIIDVSLDAGIDQLNADLSQRIFNENTDINGKSFGKYKSAAYKKFRLTSGRQIAEKDFQLFENLKKSIKSNYKDNQLEFNSNAQAEKGRGQEKQLNALIFEASNEEVERSIKAIEEEYYKRVKEIFE